jgi:hypothetical protein
MMLACTDQDTISRQPRVKLGAPLSSFELAEVKRNLHLNCHKWDTQVGDESIIFDQALILPAPEWNWLCRVAERLAAETMLLETAVLETCPDERLIGVPRALWQILLSSHRGQSVKAPGTRAMRFDFHPTIAGWRVSEVNSDVPGGWTEATNLPILYRPFYKELELPASPLDAWSKSMRSDVHNGRVALLSAPGYLEDQQVVFAFMRKLQTENVPCTFIQKSGRSRLVFWSNLQNALNRPTNLRACPVLPAGMALRFAKQHWMERTASDCRYSSNKSGYIGDFRKQTLPFSLQEFFGIFRVEESHARVSRSARCIKRGVG